MHIGAMTFFSQLHDPDFIAESGRVIEAAGFHSMWMPEHVLFFPEYHSRYPYTADGRLPGGSKILPLDPFVAMSYVAANTKKVRLGTGICLVPQRAPVYTAKQVADVDYLSNGRVDFGIGIGWLKEEFDSLGVPFAERAARTSECIALMKTLWTEEIANHEGRFYRVNAAYQNPKPKQKPHPPIFVGGESDAALERVATLGDGWYGFGLNAERTKERLAMLERKLTAVGRRRGDIQVFVSPTGVGQNLDELKRIADLGVEQMILVVADRTIDGLKRRCDETMSRVQSLRG